ncbi:mucin-7 isoform X1 [Drosophila kikkawai]|uniref:Mucin-7 isoform X1 n=1 Tax=Drosophila kikkawai TaxID=30033 RepID=A0A6P4I992_DROKI|nr:mucin-5AC [Drosophila kikkawai]
MLRSLAIPLLLLMAVAIDARAVKPKSIATTEDPAEETTYMHLPEGTVTVDIDSDLILTTSPEGEIFTDASPLELTEEPLPDSVIQQLERERAQEERARNPHNSEPDTDEDTEDTTTEKPSKKNTKKTYRFGATTTMPLGFNGFTTLQPEITTTGEPEEDTEDTTQYEEISTVRTYFKRHPASPVKGADMEMAENRMETTTDALTFQVDQQDFLSTSALIMTTEANLVEEPVTSRGEADRAESGPNQSPLFHFFTTTPASPVVTETETESTTILPETKEEEVTTMSDLMKNTEVPLPSATQVPESITEPAVTTTTEAAAVTEPEPLTAKVELHLNAQLESTSSANAPETTSTTSAPEATTTPEITTLGTSAPETTTSTTSAPETTTSTTSAPETTTSTTSAPDTTTTTSTTSAPLTTVPTTKAPETTTTTSSRPILTRAPRVERIFNSDGVEVLYGYSSVVRTNHS